MTTTNTAPYGSPEWHAHNAAEVASRPVTSMERKPLTPDQLESFKPAFAKADHAPVDSIKRLIGANKEYLYKLLGPGAGIPRPAATRLAAIIWALVEKVEALEHMQTPVALAGVEKRG